MKHMLAQKKTDAPINALASVLINIPEYFVEQVRTTCSPQENGQNDFGDLQAA